MKSVRDSLLGNLLYRANSHKSSKKEFYELKSKILKKYGVPCGQDVQHVVNNCYTCRGTGWYEYQNMCFKCAGTGIHREFTCFLDKFKLGNHYFHIPNYSVEGKCNVRPNIIGYINNSDKCSSESSREAMLLLFLIFDFKGFRNIFGSQGVIKRVWLPLVWLENIKFNRKFRYRRTKHTPTPPYSGEDELPF